MVELDFDGKLKDQNSQSYVFQDESGSFDTCPYQSSRAQWIVDSICRHVSLISIIGLVENKLERFNGIFKVRSNFYLYIIWPSVKIRNLVFLINIYIFCIEKKGYIPYGPYGFVNMSKENKNTICIILNKYI